LALLTHPWVWPSPGQARWLWKQTVSTAATVPRFCGVADDNYVSFVAGERVIDGRRRFRSRKGDVGRIEVFPADRLRR
jgi:hypothetical protein